MSLPAVAALLELLAPTPVPPPLKLYSTTEDNEAPAAFAPEGAVDPCGRVATSYSYDVAVQPSSVRNRNSRNIRLFTYDYFGRYSGIASPSPLRSSAPIVMIYGAPLGVTPGRGVAQRDRCTYDSRPRTFATQGPVPRNTATDAPSFTAPYCRVPASGYSYGAPPVRLDPNSAAIFDPAHPMPIGQSTVMVMVESSLARSDGQLAEYKKAFSALERKLEPGGLVSAIVADQFYGFDALKSKVNDQATSLLALFTDTHALIDDENGSLDGLVTAYDPVRRNTSEITTLADWNGWRDGLRSSFGIGGASLHCTWDSGTNAVRYAYWQDVYNSVGRYLVDQNAFKPGFTFQPLSRPQ